MEVIVAVAIVALMAGAIAPVVYRQLNEAREKVTVGELSLFEAGLIAFYEDTGRLPTEGEGLAALVKDPGAPGWRGPYVTSSQINPEDAVREDGFGREYVYDLDPSTTPPGVADLIVTSGGADLETDSGRRNRNWDLEADTDDLFILVSTAAIDRANEEEVRGELEAIAGACSEYFRDHAAFPRYA